MSDTSQSVKPRPSPGKGRGKTHYEEGEWRLIAKEFADAGSTAARNEVASHFNTSYQTVRKRAEALGLMNPPKPRNKKKSSRVKSSTASTGSNETLDSDGYHPAPAGKASGGKTNRKNPTRSSRYVAPADSTTSLGNDERTELETYRKLVAKLSPFKIIELMSR